MQGEPRIQYVRTYVLMPPDASKEWVKVAIAEGGWDQARFTIGGSADDAGLGNLDVRRVIAINPDMWADDLEDFFKEHYPGITYIPITATLDTLGSELRKALGIVAPVSAYELKLAYPSTHIPPYITQRFGVNGHTGLDLRSSWKVWGDRILCALPGKVTHTGDLGDFGICVVVNTPIVGGRVAQIFYAHLESASVTKDQFVEIGQEIGLPDSTGTSTADHLHLGIKVDNEWIDPEPLIQWPVSFPLRGVHDIAGGQWLAGNDLKGWCVESVDLNLSPRKIDDLEYLRDKGVRVILRLNYSYAIRDGGMGTMPDPSQLAAFENAVVETMRLNPAAWGFLYCNEMNSSDEWPKNFSLTPAYYVDSYNRIWAKKPAGTRLAPGAIDPYRGDWGDWRISWRECLQQFLGADFLAFHAYTHHYALEEIVGTEKFQNAPLAGVYYNMRVLENQQAIIPSRFINLPQIVTETNHFTRIDGQVGWEPNASDWVHEAYSYFKSRKVAGVCLFRFNYDQWRFGDKPAILEALAKETT